MAYSYGLRVKALEYLEKGGSKLEASKIFGVTVRTLFNWISRKEKGYLEACKKRERKPYKIRREELIHYIKKYPDSYLREIAKFFGTSITAVFKACKKEKITLKKRRPSTKRGISKSEKNVKRS